MARKLQPLVVDYDTVHASNRRGIAHCGDDTPGRGQANVEKYPETWSRVNCVACLERR